VIQLNLSLSPSLLVLLTSKYKRCS